jgi:hypothetical protein
VQGVVDDLGVDQPPYSPTVQDLLSARPCQPRTCFAERRFSTPSLEFGTTLPTICARSLATRVRYGTSAVESGWHASSRLSTKYRMFMRALSEP